MASQILVNRPVKDLDRSAQVFKSLGFNYGHRFEDPDGHLWDVVHMDGSPAPRAASR
jgi:uncharacterized protein